MAIPGFRVAMFSGAQDLAAFVQANVTTIYQIVYSLDGKYFLFYA